MAFWLFRRKTRRKRSRSDMDDVMQRPLPSRNFNAPVAAASASLPIPARHRSIQKKTNKLRRRRAYSFESGRTDNIEISNAGVSQAANRAVAGGLTPSTGAVRSGTDPTSYFYASGHGSQPNEDVLSYHPTLRHPNKRDGQQLYRSKGSKRRKNANDLEREAELKAMSRENVHNYNKNFTPLRPAAEQWSAGRLLKKETIRAHGSFRRRRSHDDGQHPSDVSLPLAESIDSAMSSDSEQIAYTVSPFAALAPKPTLRCAPPQRPSSTAGGAMPQRFPSQRRKLAQPISEAVLKAHKRVDDLADGLDASDLRELMERDQRRRERRQQRDQERVEQRLRRAEQDIHDADDGSSVTGRSSPANLRGVMGREAAVLETGSTSAVVTSSTRRQSAQTPISPPASPSVSPLDYEHHPHAREQKHRSLESSASGTSVIEEGMLVETASNEASTGSSRLRRRSPVEEFYRPGSVPESPAGSEPPLPMIVAEERIGPQPVPSRTNSKLRQLMKLRKRLSTSSSMEGPGRIEKTTGSFSRKTSETSSARGALSWGSLAILFRWRQKAKHGSGPSSFSNLSRDSMTAQAPPRLQAQAHSHWQQHSRSQLPIQSHPPVAAPATETRGGNHPMKVSSGVPQRTLSRFREDLPDFLLSPPVSREATPEVEAVLPLPEHVSTEEPLQTLYIDAEGDDEPVVPTTVCLPHYDMDHVRTQSSHGSNATKGSMRDTPTSWLKMDDKPSPEPQQAMSLASIDSEGSWLSGRIAKRRMPGQNPGQVLGSLDSITRSFPKPPQVQRSHRYKRSWTSNETGESNDQPISQISYTMLPTVAAVSTSSEMQMTDDDDLSAIADDSYLNEVTQYSETASVSTSAFQRESVGEARHSIEEEEEEEEGEEEGEDARWGSVSQRKTAAVVTVPAANVRKSTEVLLKSFFEGEDDAGSENPDSPVSLVSPISMASSDFKDEDAGVQRATSVNLGRGHARHISAGSAKLLEIPPRDSTDAKGVTKAVTDASV